MTVAAQVSMESPAVNRGQPLLLSTAMGVKGGEKEYINGKRIGEVAGRTTAECAAVCCCCPCSMMHLLVLAVYKLPTGLCKKALRKKKKKTLLKKKKKKLLEENQLMKINKKSGTLDEATSDGEGTVGEEEEEAAAIGVIEAVELDSKMWDRFYGTGFWRSSSQREEESENEKENQNQKLR